jgi:endo-1,4-beta-mannosidase
MTELPFRYGTPAEYLELLKRTRKIIGEENPSAKIIVTADYTDTQAEAFTKEFLALGGSDYFDYLSFHPYNALDPNARFNLTETIAQEKELAKEYGKPLLISEIGSPDSGSSETQQAEVALTLFRESYENDIPIVWFYWSDRRLSSIDGKTGWGLVRTDNTVKPSYETIKEFIDKTNQGL